MKRTAGGEGRDEVLEGALNASKEEVEAGHQENKDQPFPPTESLGAILGGVKNFLRGKLLLDRSEQQLLHIVLLVE